jgi:hypothetical protein
VLLLPDCERIRSRRVVVHVGRWKGWSGTVVVADAGAQHCSPLAGRAWDETNRGGLELLQWASLLRLFQPFSNYSNIFQSSYF